MENLDELIPVSDQYKINEKINQNINNPDIIKLLVEQGGPFGNRDLYLYGEKIHGSENIQNYICSIMDKLITKCLEHGYIETLEVLMHSNKWTNRHNNSTMYETLIRPYKKEKVKHILDCILQRNPNFLHEAENGSSNCSSLYRYVIIGGKELNIEDIKDITGFVPFSTPLLSWSLFSQSDEQIRNFNTALDFIKKQFPKDYHLTIVRDLDNYAKSPESNKLNKEKFEKLNDIYQQYASKPDQFRFFVLKELIKKHKKSSEVVNILKEHLEVLLHIPEYNKKIKDFSLNKPNVYQIVEVIDSYITLQNELPVQEKPRHRIKI